MKNVKCKMLNVCLFLSEHLLAVHVAHELFVVVLDGESKPRISGKRKLKLKHGKINGIVSVFIKNESGHLSQYLCQCKT